jgi:hypothetical protein
MRRRTQTSLEKELSEVHRLLRAWFAWHRQLAADAISGPSGELVSALLDVLRTLTPKDSKALVEFVGSQDWTAVDPDTRQIALFAIDGCILKLRQKAGLPEFDDTIPGSGKPENVFQIIKAMLFPAPMGPPPGAQPGSNMECNTKKESKR